MRTGNSAANKIFPWPRHPWLVTVNRNQSNERELFHRLDSTQRLKVLRAITH